MTRILALALLCTSCAPPPRPVLPEVASASEAWAPAMSRWRVRDAGYAR